MKKLLPFVIAALVIPSAALAKGKPPTAGTHTNHGKAKVSRRGGPSEKGGPLSFCPTRSPSDSGPDELPGSRWHRGFVRAGLGKSGES